MADAPKLGAGPVLSGETESRFTTFNGSRDEAEDHATRAARALRLPREKIVIIPKGGDGYVLKLL